MVHKVAQYPTVSIVALAAMAIVLYSLWGAAMLRAQHEAAYSVNNPQTQLARN